MTLTWIIVATVGSAALAVLAHEWYFSYRYAALRALSRHKRRERDAMRALRAR